MKRFITKKKIKVPRYKLFYFITIFSIILIIITNILINVFLKKINQEEFLNIIIGNSTGNILNNYNIYHHNQNFFFHNIFGFKINKSTPTLNESNNIKDIIINDEDLGKPIVYLYNTFQTDKYTNNYYSSYSINPVVTESSFILKEYLKRHKINSIVETTSVAKTLKENNLSYNNSYKGSRILLEKASKTTKTLKYFLDIQIDNAGNDTKVTIANKDYATILFVIGSDFETYETNLKFANDLNDILKSINPNLKSSVSIRGGANYHGIYNEDFSPNTLVIHIGGKSNTIDEVTRSINILAEALALYIKEDISNEKEKK